MLLVRLVGRVAGSFRQVYRPRSKMPLPMHCQPISLFIIFDLIVMYIHFVSRLNNSCRCTLPTFVFSNSGVVRQSFVVHQQCYLLSC